MGIEQLVDNFMGNPAPLKAKVDRANANKPPNEIPRDLEEAIALQKIADIQKGAQNQQAMQAGGPQPSVVQRLQQMLGNAQQRQQPQMLQGQPSMPQQPVMAARGGSINQLMSNLGNNYAGGGIVAFAPGGEIKLGTDFASFLQKMGTDYVEYANSSPEVKANIKEMYAETKASGDPDFTKRGTPPAPAAAPTAAPAAKDASLLRRASEGTGKVAGKLLRRAGPAGLALEAVSRMGDYKIKDPDEIDTSLSGTLSDLSKGEFGRVGTGLKRGLGEAAMDAGSLVANLADYVVPGKAPVSSRYDKFLKENVENLQGPESAAAPTKEESTAVDAETEKLKRLAAARAQTGQNTNPALRPRPPAPAAAAVKPSGPPGPATVKPEVEKPEAPTGLRAAIEANILKDLNKDEDAEFKKGTTRYEGYMGLDKLLAPKDARIAEREGMQRKIQGERLPSWVEGFSRASKPIVSGGIGTILDNLGSGMEGQRKAYNTEDLKFFDEISNMKDEVLKLTIEGKYKAAAAGEAAIKAALDAKKQAEASGTSLLNTDEQTATRKQIAKDNLAARLASAGAGAGSKNMANAINAVKSDEVINRLQKDADALSKSFLPRDKAKLADVMRQIETRQNAIYKEFGVLGGLSTMAAAPGASSPGGTTRMRFDAKGNPIS